MPSRIGKHRQRFKIQSRTDAELGTTDMDITYADVVNWSGEVKNRSGKQIVDNRGQSFAITHSIQMRKYPALTKKHVIVYPVTSGMRYQIATIKDLDELGRYQELELYPTATDGTLVDPSPGTLPTFN